MGVLQERINDIVDEAAERLERDRVAAVEAQPKPKLVNVWLRWEIDPKTKVRKSLLGVHKSLRSAQLALPKEFQDLAMKYPPDSPYVMNFLNKAIERRELEE